MKIDKKLNIVIPVFDENDKPIYVHSMPISREVFETYYRVIGKTFNEIFANGPQLLGGARVAAMALKDVAMRLGVWESDDGSGVKEGLIGEIHRLTNVIISGPNGWEVIMLGEALKRNLISPDDFHEIENALVFFTVNSAMQLRSQIEPILIFALRAWSASITYLNCTEFKDSLLTSTPAGNTGEKTPPPPASPPFSIPS